MEKPHISFIGGGNMARALIGGLISGGTPPEQITVADPSQDQLTALARDFGVQTHQDNASAAGACDVLLLAVKPQVMSDVLAQIRSALPAQALVISVAAGTRLASIEQGLGRELAVVRAMPNTPALYGAGITGMVANKQVQPAQRSTAERVMGSAGETVWVDDEALMDVVTAVSGSGPAYFFALTEHLAAAGERAGLPAETAGKLARQTAWGAGRMLRESDLDPAELRRRVTSPGGTTAAALESLGENRFAALVDAAVDAAIVRGRKLGES